MKDKEHQKPENNKVLPIDQYRPPAVRQKNEEESLHQLLTHIRQVRDMVPVNSQLQEELRQRLLHGKSATAAATAALQPKSKNKTHCPRLVLWIGLLALTILTVIVLFYHSLPKTLHAVGNPYELVNFWSSDGNWSYTVSPKGDILISRQGQLLLVDEQKRYRVLNLPDSWQYHAPAFSPDGKQVAMVRQNKAGEQQIIVVPAEELTGLTNISPKHNLITLVQGSNNHYFSDLKWSPNGTMLCYTEDKHSERPQIFTVSLADRRPKFITYGVNPAWSPDNTKLVIQREESKNNHNLFLIDLSTSKEVLLGQGEQPAWGVNGFIAFVVTGQQERILTFTADGSPQHTVRQKIAEIRSVYAGNDGNPVLKELEEQNWLALSTLLVSPAAEITAQEMNWLHRLEAQGVHEPRVLLLDDADRSKNPLFDIQGKMLYFARQDGAGAGVMAVNIKEQMFNRGEN